VTNAHGHWVLTRPLMNNQRAVVLFNQTNKPAVISTTVSAIGLSGSPVYTLRDLWTQSLSVTPGPISAWVPAHGAVMLLVS
jgi:alpha-galactosidase